ncbi:DUF3021 family protein [Lactiplantibacillus plantarum]|uniref:DUF3021 family protein n=2 Tax=Lactiplantibacillus plantarum TaxID=1590 RepID=UPI000978CF59|nr:DUF3021 family protein [Lactiplantibacillus plantarum]MBS0940909.1 DUF3021 family protein [Lactiplantibacillus plantarum]MBU7471983.1 DUF3021 family protein [Lactiplantibacillus plantarum]MCT3227186.1 DUF3021 family protein [Lactiplantibacillus plantarum]MCT3275401.1 DUF3021 family protein [Lactiplantibacillus plantarum]
MEIKIMILKKIFNGLSIGSFIFLLICTLTKPIYLDKRTVLFVFILSIFISLMTFIFDIDRINLATAISIHFTAITMFIMLLDWLWNIGINFFSILYSSALIYIISYLIVYIYMLVTMNKLNGYIRRINKK